MRLTTLIIVAALLAACGGDDDAAAPTVTSAPASATSTVAPVELPDGFPADVPVPADVLLENAEAHVGTSTTIFEVTGWYDGDPIRVARDYEAALEELGYEVTSRTESPDNLYFVAEDDDWYISAGFFPDPIRNAGASVGVTIAPAGTASDTE